MIGVVFKHLNSSKWWHRCAHFKSCSELCWTLELKLLWKVLMWIFFPPLFAWSLTLCLMRTISHPNKNETQLSLCWLLLPLLLSFPKCPLASHSVTPSFAYKCQVKAVKLVEGVNKSQTTLRLSPSLFPLTWSLITPAITSPLLFTFFDLEVTFLPLLFSKIPG